MMNKTQHLFKTLTVFLFFLLLCSTAAYATMIPIENASFETSSGTTFRSRSDLGTWSLRDMTGWTHLGSREHEWGIWDPVSTLFPSIPDGDYIGYLVGGSIVQDLDWTVAANTQLSFQIDIGNRPDISALADYSVELWAGDALLVSDGSIMPADGEFSTLSFGYTVYDGDPIIGSNLGLKITNSGGELVFDNIVATNDLAGKLGENTAPVPEPATMLLLGTGMVGLAGFGRKKFFKK